MSSHHKTELDPEAAVAVERAKQFFTATTPPPFLAAAEARFTQWADAQRKANRKVICVTSGGTTVPLEQNTVRFIDNFSTGGRGAACTEQFLASNTAFPSAHSGASSGDAKQDTAPAVAPGYAVLLLRRTGSVCPFARHIQRYLTSAATAGSGSASGAAAGSGFDLSLFAAMQFDGAGRLVLSPPPPTASASTAELAASAAAVSAASAELKQQLAVYGVACATDRFLCWEFTSIAEYLFLFRAAAQAVAPLQQRAALFLAAAVSDFHVPEASLAKHKIQSATGPLELSLPQVPKLLKLLKAEWAPAAFAVSFKLETDHSIVLKKAKGAIASYRMDCVVANQLNTRNDRVVLVLPAHSQPLATDSKAATASASASAGLHACVVIARKGKAAGEIEAPLCRVIEALHCEFIASAGARALPADATRITAASGAAAAAAPFDVTIADELSAAFTAPAAGATASAAATAAAPAAATATAKYLNAWKTAGGTVFKYSHTSATTASEMKFCAFVPPNATKDKPVPALYWLSGLTCNEDNFVQKAGAFKAAAAHGVALICPDTSPRGVVDGEAKDGWDFGVGAGFYVNATTARWAKHYRMYDYVTQELPQFVRANLPVTDRQSIFGHSMGGHGALVCHLKNPGLYASVSAFSPICHPSVVPWGIKAFTGYLGAPDAATATDAAAPATTAAAATDSKAATSAPAVVPASWKAWDATELIGAFSGPKTPILIDQGASDEFLAKGQLKPEDFAAAAKAANYPVTVNMREGYDHSYFFISSFVDSHIEHHAKYLHAAK